MKTETRYEITVWNQTNGDVEKFVRSATQAELEEIEDRYGDDPIFEVVIDSEWEAEIDDEE